MFFLVKAEQLLAL